MTPATSMRLPAAERRQALIDTALRVFTARGSQMEAVEKGWVTTFGSPEYTRKISGLMQRLDALLS